jgi:hypothetical protein
MSFEILHVSIIHNQDSQTTSCHAQISRVPVDTEASDVVRLWSTDREYLWETGQWLSMEMFIRGAAAHMRKYSYADETF